MWVFDPDMVFLILSRFRKFRIISRPLVNCFNQHFSLEFMIISLKAV